MKEITYQNKKIKLPFPEADYSDQPLELEEVKIPSVVHQLQCQNLRLQFMTSRWDLITWPSVTTLSMAPAQLRNGLQYVKAWTGLDAILQKNTWCY